MRKIRRDSDYDSEQVEQLLRHSFDASRISAIISPVVSNTEEARSLAKLNKHLQNLTQGRPIAVPVEIEPGKWLSLAVKKLPDNRIQIIFNDPSGRSIPPVANNTIVNRVVNLINTRAGAAAQVDIIDIQKEQREAGCNYHYGTFTVDNIVKFITEDTLGKDSTDLKTILTERGSHSSIRNSHIDTREDREHIRRSISQEVVALYQSEHPDKHNVKASLQARNNDALNKQDRRLDSLARLITGKETCAATCFDGTNLLVSNNSGDFAHSRQWMGILNSFANDPYNDGAEIKATAMQNVKVIATGLVGRKAKLQRLKNDAMSSNDRETLGIIRAIEEVNQAIIADSRNSTSQTKATISTRLNRLVALGESAFSSQVASSSASRQQPSTPTQKLASEITRPVRDAQKLMNGLRGDGSLEQAVIEAIKSDDVAQGGRIQYIGGSPDIHAEMKITQALVDNGLTRGQRYYIGIAKLACCPCSIALDEFGQKHGVRIGYDGTHGGTYERWQPTEWMLSDRTVRDALRNKTNPGRYSKHTELDQRSPSQPHASRLSPQRLASSSRQHPSRITSTSTTSSMAAADGGGASQQPTFASVRKRALSSSPPPAAPTTQQHSSGSTNKPPPLKRARSESAAAHSSSSTTASSRLAAAPPQPIIHHVAPEGFIPSASDMRTNFTNSSTNSSSSSVVAHRSRSTSSNSPPKSPSR